MSIKTGATVRLIPPREIRGVVIERRINPATDELEMLVEWTEGGSDYPVRRWCDADLLEEVPA